MCSKMIPIRGRPSGEGESCISLLSGSAVTQLPLLLILRIKPSSFNRSRAELIVMELTLYSFARKSTGGRKVPLAYLPEKISCLSSR